MAAQAANSIYTVNYIIDKDTNIIVSVPVKKSILMKSEVITNMFDNLGADVQDAADDNVIPIPAVRDSLMNVIIFSKEELLKFFELFEKCDYCELPTDNLDSILDREKLSEEILKKYILLANYLHNDNYKINLCKYAAKLIRNGKFRF
jgi:hypothetical protein